VTTNTTIRGKTTSSTTQQTVNYPYVTDYMNFGMYFNSEYTAWANMTGVGILWSCSNNTDLVSCPYFN